MAGAVATTTYRRGSGVAGRARRVGGAVAGPLATIALASFVISVGLSLAPGDPVAQVVGPRPTPERIETARTALGLDKNAFERYGAWVGDAVQGDLGRSIAQRESVTSLIEPRLATTALLVGLAGLLILVVGVSLGIAGGAVRALGPAVAIATALAIAVPTFVAAQILVDWFALDRDWFPATGAGSGFADRLYHLTLPAIALALSWTAYVAQITRTAIREEYGREHVETARGRGLPATSIFRRHVLRNAAIPIVTISGLTLAGLVASSVVVEVAFGLDGVGSLLVQSILAKDYNVVQGIAVMLVIVFVLVTTSIDALHVALDPRLRRGSSR
jgi:peptide/nickel transport system permease protein